jgi:hypothetical protein
VAHVPSQPLRLAARSIPFDQTSLDKSWSDVPLQPPPHLAAGSIFVEIIQGRLGSHKLCASVAGSCCLPLTLLLKAMFCNQLTSLIQW